MEISHKSIQSIKILQKPPQQRKYSDTLFLYDKFKHLNFFKQFLDQNLSQIVIEILLNLEYTNLDPYQIVFKQGSIAKKFYIILTGKVHIMIKNTHSNDQICPDKEFLNQFKDNAFFFNQENGKFNHTIVASLEKGNIFGELGILTNQLRLATVVTCQQTEFAVMDSESFKGILKPSIQSQIDQKLKVLENILGKECEMGEIYQIGAYFTQKEFKKKQQIFKEKDFAKNIYLIYKGKVAIKKCIEIMVDNVKNHKEQQVNQKDSNLWKEIVFRLQRDSRESLEISSFC